jgi:hypothetical protein
MRLKTFKLFINESYSEYVIVDKETFKDALLDLATLDLEDNQVGFPNSDVEQNHLFGGNNYDLYILNRLDFPNSGSFEILINNNDEEVIGFIRGNKLNKIISFNMIYINEEFRGKGIGFDIYLKLLNQGYIIKSDSKITNMTYDVYYKLVIYYDYIPIIFNDNRVGVKK